jgi:hypothetical protein
MDLQKRTSGQGTEMQRIWLGCSAKFVELWIYGAVTVEADAWIATVLVLQVVWSDRLEFSFLPRLCYPA